MVIIFSFFRWRPAGDIIGLSHITLSLMTPVSTAGLTTMRGVNDFLYKLTKKVLEGDLSFFTVLKLGNTVVVVINLFPIQLPICYFLGLL